ncbi:MAG: type II secretion system F family protein [Candidatus Aenigmarchaeota archaeon]|nr:type II secretion system F family protein [Candidatus Aenigmarchaeota archaeon]
MSFLDRFFKKIPSEEQVESEAKQWISQDYKTFIQEEHPEDEGGFTGFFVSGCKFAGKTLKMQAPQSISNSLSKHLLTTDIDVTPSEVLSFTVFTIIIGLGISIPLSLVFPFLGYFLPFFPFIFAYLFYTYPAYLSAVTKIKANDETVKVILYMVIYLRLNPQVEGAIRFAAAHASGPIGKDLKKIIWDVEIRKYYTINQAIGSKIEKWLLWDKEFVEAMNLIQALALETNEQAREKTLDKTLNFVLDSTYEKMKDYSRELRTPIMLIHTMGITFPIMGLVMFPMIAIFLSEDLNPGFLIFGYIVVLPLLNYFYLRRTIAKRPGAFAYPDISHHPDLPPQGKLILKISGKKYLVPILPISLIIMFFLLIPTFTYLYVLTSKFFAVKDLPDFADRWRFEMKAEYDNALSFTFYSLSGIWGMGLALVIYFYGSSYQRLKIRNDIKLIEDEFQIGLFRLGDVLSSGVPIETALEETLDKYRQYKLQDSPMFIFFLNIQKNIRELGMTLKRAIFDEQYGVMRRYPSFLIKDVMSIIVSAAEKSSIILSTASKTISSFLMKTKNVENLLKELLDEVSAAIQLQSSFIAPFITGIVAGMATFIIRLLGKLSEFMKSIEETFNLSGSFIHGGTVQFGQILSFASIEKVIPATVFQLVVGIYMLEIVVILSYFLNGIKNGFDKTTRNVLIGKGVMMALIFYSIVLVVGIVISGSFFDTDTLGGISNVGT